MSESNTKPFLSAEWRHLVMLNYAVPREILQPFVPAGTALDTYQGKAYASVVGFLFLKTRVLGMSIPFHQEFEELNLRFYVRRFSGQEWRRGVVFIKEIVPKAAVAAVARICYHENYVSLPMRHHLEMGPAHAPARAEYAWKFNQRWNHLKAKTSGESRMPVPGSLEEFITEHYWGYAAQKEGGCVEYRVEHPRWPVRRVTEAEFDCDAAALYGPEFAACLSKPPNSAFWADGSAVTVYQGGRIGQLPEDLRA